MSQRNEELKIVNQQNSKQVKILLHTKMKSTKIHNHFPKQNKIQNITQINKSKQFSGYKHKKEYKSHSMETIIKTRW